MTQLEFVISTAVLIICGLLIGYLIAKRKRRIPVHQVLVERITYDYLLERDELLTSLQKTQEEVPESRVMYAVKSYAWNN